ncbi:MAG: cysteine desulfurase-like protein [Gemmatimonadetes bacterium SCN 70-22]|nr:MAG: cysteine desulfurase-like protein [Gemmatimonadetes bacterium SCN 70-22]
MTSLQGASALIPVSDIRARFPALKRWEGGHPVAYFDGPGGTQVPREVVEAMSDYLYHHNANTHWEYPTSHETDAALEQARAAAADLLNAGSDEVAFGNNMTTITFHVSRALGRRWSAGDEVIVTELDHHANVAPWRELARDRGLVVRTVRMDPASGTLDWDDLRRAFTPRTKLLAIGAASNALGTVTDVAAAARLAHEAGALCYVDAVHYAAHGVIDVKAWDCDFLACSAYKFYGPHAGVFYGRRGLIDGLDVPKLEPAPNAGPERLETGTQNHEGIVGTGAAIEFMASLAPGGSRRERLTNALSALHARGEQLVARLWNGLREVDGVTLYGVAPGGARTPTVIFTVAGRSSTDVARALVPRGIYASNGDFYAVTVIERLGESADGVVRAGCACYTTEDEVDRLVAAVAELGAR